MKAYTLSLSAKTLTITKAFEDAVASGEGAYYELYMRLMKDIPGLTVIRKTHATPHKYISKSTGEISRCNPFKNLNYENMETFMLGLPNGEEYMNEYLFLRNHAAKIQTNGYPVVRRWFTAQFPDYRKNPLVYLHTQPAVISASEVMEQCGAEAA